MFFGLCRLSLTHFSFGASFFPFPLFEPPPPPEAAAPISFFKPQHVSIQRMHETHRRQNHARVSPRKTMLEYSNGPRERERRAENIPSLRIQKGLLPKWRLPRSFSRPLSSCRCSLRMCDCCVVVVVFTERERRRRRIISLLLLSLFLYSPLRRCPGFCL